MGSLFQDVRYGIRLLVRQPGFTLVALLVLTLGIGVNTAAFSLVNTLLLKPRVGGVDQQLAGVYSRNRTRPDAYRDFSWTDYAMLRDQPDLFAAVTAHGFGLAGLTDGNTTRRVFADIVTASYFDTFGVSPMLGRGFTADEERPGANVPVTVIGYGLWRRMGAPADVVGKPIEINQRPFTIVGVAPRGFGGSIVFVTPELWVPTGVWDTVAFDPASEGKAQHLGDAAVRGLIVVARLPTGTTMTSLTPRLDVVTSRMAAADPAANRDYELQLAPLSRLSVSTSPENDSALAGFTALLLSLAGVVMLIASFNLANMLLAHGRSRSREFAVRLAIGGSRRRLVRQLLTESLLLAVIGGAGGLVVASMATRLLFLTLPTMLPVSLTFDSSPDARVLTYTVLMSVVATLVVGLGPSLRLARTDVLPELKEQTGATPRGRSWLRWLNTRDALVMGQLALTFVMLTAAGLFVRGAVAAAASDPGFTLDRGIIANVDTAIAGYTPERSIEFYRTALDRLRNMPGVERAGFSSNMPFGEIQDGAGVQRPGPVLHSSDPAAEDNLADATLASISSGYFDATGIRLVGGRDFTPAEAFARGGDPIAIIDVTLARQLFGEESPIGRSVQMNPRSESDPPLVLRVVGLAAGVRPNLFDATPQPYLYLPFARHFHANLYIHARTAAASPDAEAAMLPSVRKLIASVDDTAPIVALETRPMFRARNLPLAIVRSGAVIFGVFGAAALFLAAVGIYGVKSYLVSRRTREIGLRVALGAEPRDVVWMVVREGLALGLVGLVSGVGLSLLTGQAARGALFQGRAFDLPVIALAAGVLVAAMLLASWVPARRATRVPPAVALRTQ